MPYGIIISADGGYKEDESITEKAGQSRRGERK
jgi:hypothetical protein